MILNIALRATTATCALGSDFRKALMALLSLRLFRPLRRRGGLALMTDRQLRDLGIEPPPRHFETGHVPTALVPHTSLFGHRQARWL